MNMHTGIHAYTIEENKAFYYKDLSIQRLHVWMEGNTGGGGVFRKSVTVSHPNRQKAQDPGREYFSFNEKAGKENQYSNPRDAGQEKLSFT